MKLTSIDTLPETRVSHNPVIKKRVLIANGEIPRLTNFSRAIFPAGEVAPVHNHSDMVEVFYIENGFAVMEVDGQDVQLPQGTCIVLEPGENHELKNLSTEPMVVLYFGLLAS